MDNLLAKPIVFDYLKYFSQGWFFLKNNYKGIAVPFLCTLFLFFIPFMSFNAVGNFFKYCRKSKQKEGTSLEMLFDFSDSSTYIKLFVTLIAMMMIVSIPILSLATYAYFRDAEPNSFFDNLVGTLFWSSFAFFVYAIPMAFFISGLISLGDIKDIKSVFKLTKEIIRQNFVKMAVFFTLVLILGVGGFYLFGIGILITIPFSLIIIYSAIEDVLQQINTV